MPTLRLKISFSQIVNLSVFPVQIAATFAFEPTFRSIQSRWSGGEEMPPNSDSSDCW